MSFEQLVKLLIPPSNPFEAVRSTQWKEVERKLGVSLPKDYINFMEIYGTGAIDDFIYVFNPFASNQNLNLFSRTETMLSAYAVLHKEFPSLYPFSVFPSSEGLLPWGISDNGDEFYWKTTKELSNWAVITFRASDSYYEVHDVSFSQYLFRLLSGELETKLFPETFRNSRQHFFRPILIN